MRKVLETMLVVSACMLVMSSNAYASEPTDGQIVDGSILTHEIECETTKLFEWNFNDSEEVMPLGVYYAAGSCGIAKKSSHSVYISATTECYEKCDKVTVEVTLQKLKNSTWGYVTSRSNTEKKVYHTTASDYISVEPGYYYRTVSFHSATKDGKTETGAAAGKGIYIG